MKIELALLSVFLALPISGISQNRENLHPKPGPVQSATPAPPLPALSELEKTKLENINLKYLHDEDLISGLRNDEKDLAAQFNAYKVSVETSHPGYTLGPDGKGGTALVAVPKPIEKPTAPSTPDVKPNPVPDQKP